MKRIFFATTLLVTLIFVGIFTWGRVQKEIAKIPEQVACTMEAKYVRTALRWVAQDLPVNLLRALLLPPHPRQFLLGGLLKKILYELCHRNFLRTAAVL